MKNASLITTIIALLVCAAGGYFIGNKGSKNETASNKIKNSNVISGNGPSSANRQSGASSKKDQREGIHQFRVLKEILPMKLSVCLILVMLQVPYRKFSMRLVRWEEWKLCLVSLRH